MSRETDKGDNVMSAPHAKTSDVLTLNRILRPDVPTFSPEAAQDILALDFDPTDKDRMRGIVDPIV